MVAHNVMSALGAGVGYADLIDFLRSEQPGRASIRDWQVVRVGRNRVWRAQSGQHRVFVKLAESTEYFRRECYGLHISQEMAHRNHWIVAPEIVYADAAQHAIIMTALPGEDVAQVMRLAFRMDHNPLRRTEAINGFLAALDHVVRWLSILHQFPFALANDLFDHSATRVRDRVLSKTRRAVQSKLLPADFEVLLTPVAALALPKDTPLGLITGDATLGNFLWDGRRIGRIDFEDLGLGDITREHTEVRQSLSMAGAKPWYWSTRPALAKLSARSERNQELLYRLEWALDRHWPGRKPARNNLRMRRLQRQIRRMLEALRTC
jgi:aminoglycoside phosphotransferase